MQSEQPRFWEQKSLLELSRAEWESLCDGCGLCCLIKVEDEDTNDVFLTRLACRLLDCDSCRCSNYEDRQSHVPDCIVLVPELVAQLDWLPPTCAYRRVGRGEPLPEWHHLVCADREAVHRAGVSVRGKAIRETERRLADVERYLIAGWDGTSKGEVKPIAVRNTAHPPGHSADARTKASQ